MLSFGCESLLRADSTGSFQGRVNTTDATGALRRARSLEELARLRGMSLAVLRGGDRFDLQWARATQDLEHLGAAHARQEDERRELEAKIAEYSRALEEAVQEIAGLRARQPTAVARRLLKGAAARAGLLGRR